LGAAVRFAVRLTPRRGPDRVDGVRDGALLVRVGAAPVDGAANEALVRLLAAELDLPRTAVRLVSGATGRRKVVAAEGEGIGDAARARWPGLAVG
jgi:uncharacterized protein YggU (UPF0235/DUF167 family)